ncbi:DNA starvation/stationary phase protection protein [Streptococcus ratti]|uniref:DNA starvation/stationary phase protection protein n=2 Tax=Streptococcus ratti TaxID=1341 RepID=A0A7X9LEF5_STRRT|nr:DNA starvation/stationary phase protection protein [Streptococcus ratti]VEI59518.1 peroxide resistance protein [Streptococcus mutans]EJN95098.1 peroxide resistance protein Dpr [Streptococcus ratti FA-1 = DSM 20564]EMP70488.1 peroxide resistance protein [Streptococcus ratti FA-1 = DSM 20564]NMD49394.1 DNA starvation/stationary phase protection protein [Streptococcus ratti]QEY07094.1 DNA starvation/stationary phase protection protein [Streptococcus ratti]
MTNTNTLVENIYASITHQVEKKEASGNEKTKAVLNQAVADLSKAASIVHQVHWYMRGAGFLYLHPKMDELMDALNAHLDEISERLITIGGSPFSTLKEFDENSKLEEEAGSWDKAMADHLSRLVEVYSYLSNLYQVGLDVTDEEGDAVSNDIFTAAQTDAQKTVWMLQAELGQAPGL